MKPFICGLLVSLAFIAGSLHSQFAWSVVPSARAGGETGRWLYRCDYINLMGTATDQLNQVTGKLNEMGRQGWELVPIVINPTIPGKMYCFRSPLQ